MIISAHIIAGGVAGEWIGNPVLAFLAGIILHFILDSVPHFDNFFDKSCHWDWRQKTFTSIDLFLTIGLLIVLHPVLAWNSPFWWGALGGLLPDLIDNLPILRDYLLKYKIIQKYHIFHEATHFICKPGILIGLLTQAITIAFFVALHFLIR